MAGIHYKRRFLKGLFTALRVLLSYKVEKAAGIFFSPERRAARRNGLHRRNARMIREKAIGMKGVMIKVGQFLSSRIDFLPDEYIEELSQLQDQVPPHDFGGIRLRIADELGGLPEEIFSEFEHEPIAAASLGQVHRARLKDGREVAVKVQYPEIDGIIETDIRMFGVLIRILRGRYGGINLRILHEEFSRIIRAELDYVREAKNAERFARNFADDDRIVIPKVVWDFSRKKVLTLEFVGGVKITDCDPRTEGIDCRATVNLLAETYARMIFVHGFFHGDPHPGNIFVQEGPRLVFVDFGMVQAIPDTLRRELRRLAGSIVDRDTGRLIESMEAMGFIMEGADYDRLAIVAQSMIDKYRDIAPADLKALTIDDIAKEVEEVLDIFEYVQIPNNFILLGRTIGILNGIAFRLNPDANMIEIATPYVRRFLRGSGEEQARSIIEGLRAMLSDLWGMPSEVRSFLARANRGELSVKLSKPEIREITGQFKSLTDVMMFVVLTVTASTAGLLLVIMESRRPALFAAGSAVVLGLLSVFRLLRR